MFLNTQSNVRIGTFIASLPPLANALSKYVSNSCSPNILEVGAGTGAVTTVIVKKLGKNHHLDVIEIVPEFAAALREKFATEKYVSIHQCDILEFDVSKRYDVIVSCLPFNAFKPNITKAMIDRLIQLSRQGAILSFPELKFIPTFAPIFLSNAKLNEYYGSRRIIDEFIEKYKFAGTTVYLNLPPASVHYLRIWK